MSTLAEIIADARLQIDQTDSSNSDFTQAQLIEYLNKAIRFAATKILYPRKSGTVSPTAGTKNYSYPSDFMHLFNDAFYGDSSVQGGLTKLRTVILGKMNSIDPNWLESTSQNEGDPAYLVLLNRTQFSLHPAPNTAAAASGNLIRLYYAYYPAAITSDSDTPDLPTVVHDLLSTYIAHLCYGGKLKNQKLATEKLNEFMAKLKLVELPSTQETYDWQFVFGGADKTIY